MSEPELTTSCPVCGSAMKLRSGAKGKFYGCLAYPSCRGTRPYTAPPAPPVQPSLLSPASSPVPAVTTAATGELVQAIRKLTDAVEALTAQLAARPLAPADDDPDF